MKHTSMGKYTLIEVLAKGGMAEVHLAQNHMSDEIKKLVAIKKILPDFSSNRDFVLMFKDEAKVLVKMNHNNIVSTFDFGTHEGHFYLVMEYVHGKNLRQILMDLLRAKIKLPMALALFIIKEAAQGLAYTHNFQDLATDEKLEIVHRDVSPHNIMVGFDGSVKVIDFGIAKSDLQVEQTKNGTIKGKYGYMSPEQALGYDVDHRTDVFSLGVILWEMLANRRLIGGNPELFPVERYKDFQPPSFESFNIKVPFQVERIVRRALERERRDRYDTMADMLKDLTLVVNFLCPDLTAGDLSIFLRTNFAQGLKNNQEWHTKVLQSQEPPERTELLEDSEANTQTQTPTRSGVLRFRNQFRIQKKGVSL